MARLHNLPVEIVVTILTYCSSPHDIFSLVKSDPWALHCFLGSRKLLLEDHLRYILAMYGGLISNAHVLAAELRHAKLDPIFANTAFQQHEEILGPILRSYVALPDDGHDISYRASLSTICSLSTLATEVQWVTTSYAKQACEEKSIRIFIDLSRPARPRRELQLSTTEKQTFINAACRFESYVQAFFLKEQPLFPQDMYHRGLLFSQSLSNFDNLHETTYIHGTPYNSPSLGTIESFYSMVYYIFDQHWEMLVKVIGYVTAGGLCPIQTTTRYKNVTYPPENQKRLQNLKQIEASKYVHYLTSQGLGMLLRLQSMPLHDQAVFVVSTLLEILESHYPVVLMVHEIRAHRLGTVEKDSWQPWAFCQQAYGSNLATHWKRATLFWDRPW